MKKNIKKEGELVMKAAAETPLPKHVFFIHDEWTSQYSTRAVITP